MSGPEIITRTYINVRDFNIAAKGFPVRQDLTGLMNIQNGGLLTRQAYDDTIESFRKLDLLSRETFADLAKLYKNNSPDYSEKLAGVSDDRKREFTKAGLSLRDEDFRIVHDHVHAHSKGYDQKIIDVHGRPVFADASAATISFNMGQNISQAERLMNIFRTGSEAEITSGIRREGNLDIDFAREKARAVLANPLLPTLDRK